MSQLYCESGDVDLAIAELDRAFGDIAAKKQIESLQARIARLRAERRNTMILQRELVEAMAKQIRREVAV